MQRGATHQKRRFNLPHGMFATLFGLFSGIFRFQSFLELLPGGAMWFPLKAAVPQDPCDLHTAASAHFHDKLAHFCPSEKRALVSESPAKSPPKLGKCGYFSVLRWPCCHDLKQQTQKLGGFWMLFGVSSPLQIPLVCFPPLGADLRGEMTYKQVQHIKNESHFSILASHGPFPMVFGGIF